MSDLDLFITISKAIYKHDHLLYEHMRNSVEQMFENDNVLGQLVALVGETEKIEEFIVNKYNLRMPVINMENLCMLVGLHHRYREQFNNIWGDLKPGDKDINSVDTKKYTKVDHDMCFDEAGFVDLRFYDKTIEDYYDYIIPLVCYHEYIGSHQTPICDYVYNPDQIITIKCKYIRNLDKYKDGKFYMITFKDLLTEMPEYNTSLMKILCCTA